MELTLLASAQNPYMWDFPDPKTGKYFEEPYDEVYFWTKTHQMSHFVTMGLGGLFSFTLLYLVLFETKGSLHQYSRMLLLCSVCDVGYWLVDNLVQVKTKVNDGCLLARLEGIAKYTSYNFQAFATSVYACQLTLIVTILPSQYYYRYCSVTRAKSLNGWQTLLLYLTSLFFAVLLGVLAYPSYRYSAQSRSGFNYGKIWYREQPLPPVMIADFSSIHAKRYLVYCTLSMLVSYSVSLFFAYRTMKILKANEHMYSIRTKSMQQQLTMTLLFQTIMPLFISCGPVVCVCLGTFFRRDTGVMSLVVLWFASWIPVLNPLLTIWVIKPFRRTVLNWFRRRSAKVDATTSGQGNRISQISGNPAGSSST